MNMFLKLLIGELNTLDGNRDSAQAVRKLLIKDRTKKLMEKMNTKSVEKKTAELI
jgi:hypothetical protein